MKIIALKLAQYFNSVHFCITNNEQRITHTTMKSTPHHEDSADYVIIAAMQDAADDEKFSQEQQAAFLFDYAYIVRDGLPREIETTEEADALYEQTYNKARQVAYELADAKNND